MEGIRLRPGQRRKSIRRRKIVRQKHQFEQADEMLTFAELGLKSESQIFARKFKHIQYSNYPNQFKSIEVDTAADGSEKSADVFSDSASSKGRASIVKSKEELVDHNVAHSKKQTRDESKTEFEIVKCLSEDNIKICRTESEDKAANIRDECFSTPYIQDPKSLTIPIESSHDNDAIDIRDTATKEEIPATKEEIPTKKVIELKPPNLTDILQNIPREKSAGESSVKLPQINVTSAGRRQVELSTVSRKQDQGALEAHDSQAMSDSQPDTTYYRSAQIITNSMSDISLDMARTDSRVSSDLDSRLLTISDSDECNTDLEPDENFGRDPIPESDLNIGRKVYTKECERLGKPPQKYILKCLPQRSMTLRNRSLGKNGIAPLCKALKVFTPVFD